MEAEPGAVLEVDLGAIAANWRLLCGRHRGAVAGVVKADAYGLQAARVVPALYAAGCRHFFVAHLSEALHIRPLAPDAMIAVLDGLLPGDEPACIAGRIDPVLGSMAEIDRWRDGARMAGRPLPALLHIDTGMSRLGLDPTEVDALKHDPSRLDGIAPRYLMTHLVSAELADDALNEAQRVRFAAACAGLPALPLSIANSSGIFLGDRFASDLARPGAALYGVNPTPGRPNPMRPVAALRGRVLRVRDIAAGETVGYNATWTATRPSRIATVPVGYADGWLRSLSNRGAACFDGRTVPLVGRVSMDLTTFDVTDRPEIGPGAWLELIGPSLPVDTVAEAAGTNGYEILTSLGARYRRVFRG
jgi:alanine racemase